MSCEYCGEILSNDHWEYTEYGGNVHTFCSEECIQKWQSFGAPPSTKELRELIQQWRENGDVLETQHPDPVAERGRGLNTCADELEALLDD